MKRKPGGAGKKLQHPRMGCVNEDA